MIAALYARYSSDSQRAESIVAQIRAGREYCRRKGYHIIKEYADEAYTGTNDNRPAYREMLRDAAAGEVFAFGNSEAGNDLVMFGSRTRAERQPDGGWKWLFDHGRDPPRAGP